MKRLIKAGERGQVLVIAAVLLPVLLAMAGMAIDVGGYSSDRRALQNAADAIALAGAQELCDPSCTDYDDVYAAAEDILDEYEIDPDDVTIAPDGSGSAPHVRVTINRPHDFVFMQVVGIDSRNVAAQAQANKVSWGGGSGVVPWAVTDDIASNAGSGQLITMKYDSNSVQNGNFGPIRIDSAQGEGSQDYENSATFGSSTHICADSTENCDDNVCSASDSFPGSCAEDAEGCDGAECKAKTGNMVGGTENAVDFRIDNTSASCDTFEEVFEPASAYSHQKFEDFQLYVTAKGFNGKRLAPPPTRTPRPTNTVPASSTPAPSSTPVPPSATPAGSSPTAVPTSTTEPTSTPIQGDGSTDKYRLNNACNPWIDGPGKCENNEEGTLCSRRVIIIPIIDTFGNGSEDVTVVRFALMFLEGYGDNGCSGNECEIKGRFVRADFTSNALAGIFDPAAPIQFVKLTE